VLIANYSKNRENEFLQGLYCKCNRRQLELRKAKRCRRDSGKTKEVRKRGKRESDEDNMLKSKMTQDHCLSLQPIKRLRSHLLYKEEFQE